VIGGEVPQLGGSALAGGGDLFVLEADEYGGAFANLDPTFTIITNVEWEHPDLFGDEAAVRSAFVAFARRVRPGGRLVVCGDDPGVQAVLGALGVPGGAEAQAVPEAQPAGPAPVVDYGFAPERTWRAVDSRPGPGGGSVAAVLRDGEPVGTLELALPGRHAVLNALAALATAAELGVAAPRALDSLAGFTGAARRFEKIGTVELPAASRVPGALSGTSGVGRRLHVEVIDDYAHHPTEIRANVAAARQRAGGGRQVWAVVQPHTFSRLAALLDDFATAFGGADRVYVTDVYAAREHDDLGVHARDLAKRIADPVTVSYVGWPDLVGRLACDIHATAGDTGDTGGILVLTLGAGTITDIGPRLLVELSELADGC
jgi:UDP-N-acetylmuramate--alanine ligase